eukprot:439181-Heterocapsa_arctica.AAC.2
MACQAPDSAKAAGDADRPEIPRDADGDIAVSFLCLAVASFVTYPGLCLADVLDSDAQVP